LFLTAQDAGGNGRHTRDVSCVAISADCKTLASGSVDRTIRLWDPASKRASITLEGHDGEVHCVAFSHDGKLLDMTRLWIIQSFANAQGRGGTVIACVTP